GDRAHGAAPHPAAPHAPDPSAPHAPHPATPHAPERAAVDSPSMHAFRTAALALADREVSLGRGETYRRLALSTLRTTLIAATDPRATIPAAFAQRFTGMLTFAWNPPDPIDPVMAYPVFPQPMYAPLA